MMGYENFDGKPYLCTKFGANLPTGASEQMCEAEVSSSHMGTRAHLSSMYRVAKRYALPIAVKRVQPAIHYSSYMLGHSTPSSATPQPSDWTRLQSALHTQPASPFSAVRGGGMALPRLLRYFLLWFALHILVLLVFTGGG